MGTCQSVDKRRRAIKSKAIDDDIAHIHIERQTIVKLLMLGTDEGGMSMIRQQMSLLQDLQRDQTSNCEPSEQDPLLSQIEAPGVVEFQFRIERANFRVFDIGGQRSGREKWLHVFEDVRVILFIAAIYSEYDQALSDDKTRPSERAVTQSKDTNNYEAVCREYERRFRNRNADRSKILWIHIIGASYADQLRFIHTCVIDMIMAEYFRKSDLM